MKEIAIFWDIENCPVPKGISTVMFVHKIREIFCSNESKQVKFFAIYNGQNRKLKRELHELGIDFSLSLIDRKNSADDILKEKMNNFVEEHEPCTLLLISGDVDFSRDLVRFRYKNKFKTVLIYNKQVRETLKSVVNKYFDMDSIFGSKQKKARKMETTKSLVSIG